MKATPAITPTDERPFMTIALLKRAGLPLAAALLLAGCAGFAPDGGFGPVADTARERLGQDALWVRSDADRLALIVGVREGVIDAICSDHQPLNASAKLAPFAEALPGMSTLETVLPLGLKLVADGELSARRLIEALTSAPARILQKPIGALGEVASGVLLIDPAQVWQVTGDDWLSAGRNTVFAGHMMAGRARALG